MLNEVSVSVNGGWTFEAAGRWLMSSSRRPKRKKQQTRGSRDVCSANATLVLRSAKGAFKSPHSFSPTLTMLHATAGPSSQLASSSNAVAVEAQPAPGHPSSVDLPALQNASRVLYDQFAKDAALVPETIDMLTIRTSALFSPLHDLHIKSRQLVCNRLQITPSSRMIGGCRSKSIN